MTLPKPDMVNAPPHYTRLSPQPIELIEAWSLGFNLGQVVKYIARAGYKKGVSGTEDLRKAVSYLNREIVKLEGQAPPRLSTPRLSYEAYGHDVDCGSQPRTARGCACGADNQ